MLLKIKKEISIIHMYVTEIIRKVIQIWYKEDIWCPIVKVKLPLKSMYASLELNKAFGCKYCQIILITLIISHIIISMNKPNCNWFLWKDYVHFELHHEKSSPRLLNYFRTIFSFYILLTCILNKKTSR